jgi:hypothetical protein
MKRRTLPEDYFLKRVTWQIIGTLTLKEAWPVNKRRAKFIVLMRRLSKESGVHWSKLLWVYKVEKTLDGQFAHIHFLVGTKPSKAPIASFCRFIHDEWMRVGGGITRVEPYISELRGREYVLKIFGEQSGVDRNASNISEDTNEPMLSKSVIAYPFAQLECSW